jgi:ribose transport system substrate-binding protein
VKSRVIGGLVALALVGVLTTAAFGAGSSQAHKAGSIKVGVSLAGYSTDFWSSYVAFEKAAAKQYGVTLVGPISANGDAGKQATQIGR